MLNPLDSRFTLLVLFAGIVLLFSVRLYGSVRQHGWTRLLRTHVRHIVAASLLAGGVVCSVLKPAPAWAPALTVILLTYGLLVAYVIAVDMLEDRHIRLRHSALTWWVTALLGVTAVFDVLRGDNRGNFVDREPYVPTATYFIANVLAIAPMLLLQVRIAAVYWRSLRTNHALTSVSATVYTLRRGTGLVALCIAAFGLAMIEVQLVCAMLGVTSPLLDRVFTLTQSLAAPLAAALFLLSIGVRWLYILIAQALRARATYCRQHDDALLAYLQQRMRTVVPTVPHVELADPQLRWDRALSEIADARELLWSDTPRTTPITPEDEADRLYRLVQSNQQYGRDITIGPHFHPPIRMEQVVEHNLAVARALQQLEQQQLAPTEQEHH